MFLSTVKNRRIMENSSLILLEEYTLPIWIESQRIFLLLNNTHIIHTPVIPNKKTWCCFIRLTILIKKNSLPCHENLSANF